MTLKCNKVSSSHLKISLHDFTHPKFPLFLLPNCLQCMHQPQALGYLITLFSILLHRSALMARAVTALGIKPNFLVSTFPSLLFPLEPYYSSMQTLVSGWPDPVSQVRESLPHTNHSLLYRPSLFIAPTFVINSLLTHNAFFNSSLPLS